MRTLDFYNRYIGKSVAVLSGVIGLSVFLYGAFLLGAVSHAAHATQASGELRELSLEVSQLEAHYLTETKALSLERAKQLGFVPPTSVATVYAQTGSLTVR